MFDIGIVVGKFAPLTLGHINLITAASTQAKKVIIILSHDQRWVDRQNPRDQRTLSLKNRLRWLQQTFSNTPHVDITYIDETDIPEFPNGWSEYCNLLRDIIEEASYSYIEKQFATRGNLAHPDRPSVAIFSSEVSYDPEYAKRLPLVNHVIVDSERTKVPISATMIRENLYNCWDYLPSIVRKDYTRKIVVLGTESSGKTTMVRNLAKLFNTSWVEEYGRTYCETVLAGSEETLRSSDYPLIAYRHKEFEEEAMRTANRVCIVDTNAFITEFYHRLYEGKRNNIVSAIAAEEQYDAVIILAPNVPWVDDGLRINSDRDRTSKLFEEMAKEFPNQFPEGRVITIGMESFSERLSTAYDFVNGIMNRINNGEF